MNAYKMYKLPEVVKAASSSTSFKEEEREQSRFISNVRIMKQVIQWQNKTAEEQQVLAVGEAV